MPSPRAERRRKLPGGHKKSQDPSGPRLFFLPPVSSLPLRQGDHLVEKALWRTAPYEAGRSSNLQPREALVYHHLILEKRQALETDHTKTRSSGGLTSFCSLTLVVERDPTQTATMRQRLIPITLKFIAEKQTLSAKRTNRPPGGIKTGSPYLKRYSRSSLVISPTRLSEPVTMESASLRFDSWRSAILSSIDSPETNL